MLWKTVNCVANSLIDYSGTDARVNALESKVLNIVVNAHTWERFMTTKQISYPADTESLDLTTDYNDIHRLVAIRKSGSSEPPPDYVSPAEWNRLKALGMSAASSNQYWTMVGTNLFIFGAPSAATTYDLIIAKRPEHIGWGELPDEFLDYASTVLARLLVPLERTVGDRTFTSPTYTTLRALEKEALNQL